MTRPPRLYLSPPDVGEAEQQAVMAAMQSGWIAPLGPEVDAFEAEMAERVGAKHGVALSSGTAALHLARGRVERYDAVTQHSCGIAALAA